SARGKDDGGITDQGVVYLFEQPGGGWISATQTAVLSASGGLAGDGMWGVVGAGESVGAAAGLDDDLGAQSGSMYLFRRPAGGWVNSTETGKLLAPDGAAGDQFGFFLGGHEDWVIVGARDDDDQGTNSGSAYALRLDSEAGSVYCSS